MVNNVSNPAVTGLEVQAQAQQATTKLQQVEGKTKKDESTSKIDSAKKSDDPKTGPPRLWSLHLDPPPYASQGLNVLPKLDPAH